MMPPPPWVLSNMYSLAVRQSPWCRGALTFEGRTLRLFGPLLIIPSSLRVLTLRRPPKLCCSSASCPPRRYPSNAVPQPAN